MPIPHYTPTERRMLAVLADGMPHKRAELIACLYDKDQGTPANVQVHLCNLRKALRPLHQDVICELFNRHICYRHIRLLTSVDKS